jgi:hypothetical protein
MNAFRAILAIAFGAGVILGAITSAGHPRPATVVIGEGNRRVIASATITGNRCKVPGYANGAAVTYEIDTGDPITADFSASHIHKLGLNPASLDFAELWPGTRYGTIATTTLREIRVGDVVWNDPEVRIYSNWRYTFGDDETPLLGLAALNSRGVHLEFDGDLCRLTVSGNEKPAR